MLLAPQKNAMGDGIRFGDKKRSPGSSTLRGVRARTPFPLESISLEKA